MFQFAETLDLPRSVFRVPPSARDLASRVAPAEILRRASSRSLFAIASNRGWIPAEKKKRLNYGDARARGGGVTNLDKQSANDM